MTAPRLNPVEQWCVAQNVDRARTEGLDVVLDRLRANGYPHTAAAVALAQPNAETMLNGRCVGQLRYDEQHGTVLAVIHCACPNNQHVDFMTGQEE